MFWSSYIKVGSYGHWLNYQNCCREFDALLLFSVSFFLEENQRAWRAHRPPRTQVLAFYMACDPRTQYPLIEALCSAQIFNGSPLRESFMHSFLEKMGDGLFLRFFPTLC